MHKKVPFPVETITQVNGTAIAQPIESPSSHGLQIYGIVVTNDYCVMLYCTWRSEDDKSGCTCISHTCFTLTHLHIFGNSVGKGGSSHIGSYCVEYEDY
ncbi:Protein ccc1 [Trifolium repens]|nr:Protein ccc1 [Trifolium repens]